MNGFISDNFFLFFQRKLLIRSLLNPGAIIWKTLGVNKLFFIYENYLRIEISLKTFLAEYVFLNTLEICLTA
jgi:hypothetical protein